MLSKLIYLLLTTLGLARAISAAESPLFSSELIFPPEHWHNHASCLVETRRGDLLVCWFHGSGERKADDVRVEGSRLPRGSAFWTSRFLLADTPQYPDCNPCFLIDDRNRLWLFHTTILAHTWESALLKFHRSDHWESHGAPHWDKEGLAHLSPGLSFSSTISNTLPLLTASAATANWSAETRREVNEYLDAMSHNATNELYNRLGWMPRAHPILLGHRIILPLYHDGFSFSLMGISDDGGETWHCSQPLIGGGNIQPSLTQRRDGTLVAWMRDNGPPPKRVLTAESSDRGETWTPVMDSPLPNPGSGVEAIVLRNGAWIFIGNDTEDGRHSLALWHSTDEGRTWPIKRHIEQAPIGKGSFSYPSLLQSRDGSIHATYSVHGMPGGSSIRHVHLNEAWILKGD
jgi:predicted neuraminidase